MSLVLHTLLCLGLYLGQRTQAQNGTLPRPHITALPRSIVPPGDPVMILCQGPAEAEAYVISKVRSPEPSDEEKQLLSKKTNTLSIEEMTPPWAGLYHCSYHSGERWSQFSDSLQLVMTRAYEKPSLSSMTGTVVASGENVKLRCFSTLKFDAFILVKKEGGPTIQKQSSNSQDGGRQAVFLLNQVSSTQAGTYRCYGVFSRYPYVWSHPSDRLQLQVRAPFAEAPVDPDPTNPRSSPETPDDPHPTKPRPSPEFPGGITNTPTMTGGKKEPAAWHLSAENQVRLSLAGLILLVLGVLLAEAWYSQKTPLNGIRQVSS